MKMTVFFIKILSCQKNVLLLQKNYYNSSEHAKTDECSITQKLSKNSMTAYVFPGQGSQYPGMGKDLYESSDLAREYFEKANDVLGFRLTDIMFEGTEEELRQTRVTQPAVFLHSVVKALVEGADCQPDMVAGHSLGEFSALVACGALGFEDALRLVYARAMAMQRACDKQPGTMAAVIRLDDEKVEEVCQQVAEVSGEIVVPANYNCTGQIVISGSLNGVEQACPAMKEAGARRAMVLPVGGAFHSPLMLPAQEDLKQAIESVTFSTPRCPIYQNVDAQPHTSPDEIRANLLCQLTSPVRWTASVQRMRADGCDTFIEFGPGEVLTNLIAKID